MWLPTRGIEVGLGGIGSESAADRALEFVDISWGALTTSGDHGRFIEAGGRRCRRILDPRTGWPVGRWRSGSVAAPLCTVAGSCAKIAMLVERDAPSLLAAQGVAWLGIDASGARRGTLAAKP